MRSVLSSIATIVMGGFLGTILLGAILKFAAVGFLVMTLKALLGV